MHNAHEITQHSLNVLMQRLVSQGLIEHFMEMAKMEMRMFQTDVFRTQQKLQHTTNGGQYAEITLHELSSIMLLALFGQAISVVVFVIELMVARMNVWW